MELRKNSYVKIDRVYEVSWESLGAYDETGKEIVLTRDSLEVLEDAVRTWKEEEEESW